MKRIAHVLVGSFLLLTIGCVDDPTGSMFMALGSEQPTQVYEVGLDDESYDRVVDLLGMVPDGLGKVGPREGGDAIVWVAVPPDAQTALFDDVLSYQAGTGELATNFSVLLGGGTTAAALILPAVQALRAASFQKDDSDRVQLVFELGGSNPSIDELLAPLPEPQPLVDSFFDICVRPDVSASSSPDEELLIEAAGGPYPVTIARFSPDARGDDVPMEQLSLNFEGRGLVDLANAGVRMSAVVEVRNPNDEPVMSASPVDALIVINEAAGTASLEGGSGPLITYTGLEAADSGTAAQEALFLSDYTAYDSTNVDLAARQLGTVRAALEVSGQQALLEWHGGTNDVGAPIPSTKAVVIADLVDAVVSALIFENLACTMATPDTLKAGKDPAISGGLDRDLIRRFHGKAATAAFVAPPPGRLTIDMKKVLVSSLGTTPTPDGGDTTFQCDAIEALVKVLDQDDVTLTGLSMDLQNKLRPLGIALAKQRAAYLDRLAFEFVEHMNSKLPTDVGTEDEWFAAAKTKADILIESLGNEATNGPLMQAAARDILGL